GRWPVNERRQATEDFPGAQVAHGDSDARRGPPLLGGDWLGPGKSLTLAANAGLVVIPLPRGTVTEHTPCPIERLPPARCGCDDIRRGAGDPVRPELLDFVFVCTPDRCS